MGYSDDASMVRVDFFKPSGKWKYTEAMKWTGGYSNCGLFDAFKQSLRDHCGPPVGNFNCVKHAGLRAVCIEPYHEHAYPVCLDIPEEGPI